MSWGGGGGGLNDFINHLENAEEVKHEKGTKEAIMELKSLIQKTAHKQQFHKQNRNRRLIKRQNNKAVDIYGKEKKSETAQKIDKANYN